MEEERNDERQRKQEETDKVSAQLEALRSKNAELLCNISVCEDRLAEACRRADNLARENDQYSTCINELERGIQLAETAKASLLEERRGLISRAESLEKTLEENQREMRALGESSARGMTAIGLAHDR